MRLGVEGALVEGRIVPGDVEVADGRVTAVGLPTSTGRGTAVPGLVDLQVNGFGGVDFLAADAEAYRRAGQTLLATGVTAYQPTLITAPEDDVIAALKEVAGRSEDPQVVGAHVEGPFLSPNRMGTHPAAHRRDPDLGLLERYLAAGPVTTVTLAPELPGADALITLLQRRGVVVSAGHSDATAQQATHAFDQGIATVTHLFNAMRRFTPRDPGLSGVALARDDVVVQVIVDGHHLHPETVRLVWRTAAGRCALVTDAVAAAGVGDGSFQLGEVPVEVRDGAVHRGDGTLAGSALTMPEAVRNLHTLGVDLVSALAAATAVPARVLGRDDLGVLRPGGRADVVVLDDRLEVRSVYLGGRERLAG